MRIKRVLAVIVVIMAASFSTAFSAGAAISQSSTHKAAESLPQLLLPGGLKVERASDYSKLNITNIPHQYTNDGPVYVVNYSQDTFAITIQPNNSSGRLANHLYMWTNRGYNTQVLDILYDSSNNTYVFESVYNGKCINVPGSSRSSGIQLIVYSCSGYPTNEQFYGLPACPVDEANFCDLLLPQYDRSSLAMAIGNGFPIPGSGAWVIIYSGNVTNWKEQWIWYDA